MIHGSGDQYWLLEEFESKRRRRLVDRSNFDSEDLDEFGLLDNIYLGGGRTDESTYKVSQFPFPVHKSIRSRKSIDIREVDKRIGGD